MAPREAGGAGLAMGDSICTLDFDSGSITLIASARQPSQAIFNDGKVDRRGRFVLGSCCTDLEAGLARRVWLGPGELDVQRRHSIQ